MSTLRDMAFEGDREALDTYTRESLRRNDFEALQSIAERFPERGRALARRLIDAGHVAILERSGERLPDVLEMLQTHGRNEPAVSLVAPLRLTLSWSDAMQRDVALDCAERVLSCVPEPYGGLLRALIHIGRRHATSGDGAALAAARVAAEEAAEALRAGEDFFELSRPDAVWAAWSVYWALCGEESHRDEAWAMRAAHNARRALGEPDEETWWQRRRLLERLLS